MTNFHQIIKTIDLVQYLSLTNENDLFRYKNKILELEKLIYETPNNSLYKHKYNDAKMRFEHIKKTMSNIRQLRLLLKKENDNFINY
jgi:hypothetical protein